jgi:hypothetical protein
MSLFYRVRLLRAARRPGLLRRLLIGLGPRGSISLSFAVGATTVAAGVGAGIDLMRIYNVQQKITQVAALVCQYASRPSVIGTVSGALTGLEQLTGLAGYTSQVTGFATSAWGSQGIPYAQTAVTPFSAVLNGAADVKLGAAVPTTFLQIAGIANVSVSAAAHCFDSPASIPQSPTTGTYVVQEGFESAPCGNTVCYNAPTGTANLIPPTVTTPTSTFTSTASYIGSHGAKWYVLGYCLETDQIGAINTTVPEGTQAAELDCDNGSGNAGNSSISTSATLSAGNYELRWFYRSRVDYPNYDPAYICGSSVSDTSWANDQTTGTGWAFTSVGAAATRTNQINVYLDQPTAGGVPPLHTTLDGTQKLAGSNMIDTCVYSPSWVERSVRIKITTAGTYWLSLAADGKNDSFGGQVDNIRLCPDTCPGTPQDNFPSAWLAANNFGVDKVLFEDTFDSPFYGDDTGLGANVDGNLNNSTGTSGSLTSGWPSQSASGWATAPHNQMIYTLTGAAQGTQYAWMANGALGENIVTGRPFLLVPGFYNLAYRYASETIFPSLSKVYCGATPSAAGLSALSGNGTGYARVETTRTASGTLNANTLAAFIASGQLVSTPNGGGSLGSTTSYTNPDTVTADTPPVTATSYTATVPPDSISLTSYTASSTTGLLDICGYSSAWTARSIDFEITKTGLYWLFFSGRMAGSANWWGGAVDDVRLTALGSPAMTSAPSTYVTVPAAGPQPASTLSQTGYLIVADPLTFPAPTQ